MKLEKRQIPGTQHPPPSSLGRSSACVPFQKEVLRCRIVALLGSGLYIYEEPGTTIFVFSGQIRQGLDQEIKVAKGFDKLLKLKF